MWAFEEALWGQWDPSICIVEGSEKELLEGA